MVITHSGPSIKIDNIHTVTFNKVLPLVVALTRQEGPLESLRDLSCVSALMTFCGDGEYRRLSASLPGGGPADASASTQDCTLSIDNAPGVPCSHRRACI